MLVHATTETSLKSIFKHGELRPFGEEHTDPPSVHTQYMFDAIEPLSHYWHALGDNFVLCLSTTALKDLPFKACHRYKPDNVIMNSSGNLKNKPRMNKLREYINAQLVEFQKRRRLKRFVLPDLGLSSPTMSISHVQSLRNTSAASSSRISRTNRSPKQL